MHIGAYSSPGADFALSLAELHKVAISLFLQPVEVPMVSLPLLSISLLAACSTFAYL